MEFINFSLMGAPLPSVNVLDFQTVYLNGYDFEFVSSTLHVIAILALICFLTFRHISQRLASPKKKINNRLIAIRSGPIGTPTNMQKRSKATRVVHSS